MAYLGFKKLKAKIAARGGVSDPGAVAASIGRKKYGASNFQKHAAAGKKFSSSDAASALENRSKKKGCCPGSK